MSAPAKGRFPISTPWLKGPVFDLSFILAPSFLSVAAALLFAGSFGGTSDVPLWAWLVFILGIDVTHVYGTLFRTYFNPNEVRENRRLLTLIPLAVWLAGVGLYSIGAMAFWRVLAYVAVFHFIRQQYGFLRLYSRGESETAWDRRLTAATLYLATIYPIAFWHAHQPRKFHWFIDGDFLPGLPVEVSRIVGFVYVATLAAYVVNELAGARRGRAINVPRNAIVAGTATSWYVGIVHFDGDMAFTITNVVSHGIPYLALVWLYGERQKSKPDSPRILGRFDYSLFFSRASVPLFLGVLMLFAFVEEGFWSGLVWRDRLEAFGVFADLPLLSKDTLSWVVPLLATPQATHYVLDGFIWKMKDSDANWQRVLFADRREAA